MKYKYWCTDDGETVDDANAVHCERYDWKNSRMVMVDEFDEDDHENVVEDAAKLHYARSQPDWNDGEQTLSIVDEHGEVKTFEVTLEYVPSFGITEKR